MPKILLDEKEYDISSMNDACKKLFLEIKRIDTTLTEKHNLKAVLLKAKRAYLNELKTEIITAKSGLDLSDI